MLHALPSITLGTGILLVLALGLALSFEFVNGFHDTANAVATVIYTKALRPWQAVIWSGSWNLIGVLVSSGAVAFGILALLPVELVLNVGSGAGFAMVFALLVSAIIWNLGTWWFGLPASSSHTLIGAIMGVGLANSLLSPGHVFGEGVNWAKVTQTVQALLISPVIGFFASALVLIVMKFLIHKKQLFEAPHGDAPPPWWVRGLLVLTCTGVSFAHGSNDGQKGMGLIMLILIGVLPGVFAVNPSLSGSALATFTSTSHTVQAAIEKHVTIGERGAVAQVASTTTTALPPPTDAGAQLSAFLKPSGKADDTTWAALAAKNHEIETMTASVPSLDALAGPQRSQLRTDVYLVGSSIAKLQSKHLIADTTENATLTKYRKLLDSATNFIPVWVKVAVALALGFGTMIGWKRIVVTVGERIGKAHLTYAQGASAEMVAWGTIQLADGFGLPVSTTHILSSGVAGTMAANGSGVQGQTVRNIILAWVLTLPVCVFLGSMLFAGGLLLVAKLGLH
jgi:PiT family inorganic phosphate transporter